MLELFVSLPVLAFLLMAAGGMFLWLFREYRIQSYDWELRQEVQIMMARIVEEAHRGYRAETGGRTDRNTLALYRREDRWNRGEIAVQEKMDRYFVQEASEVSPRKLALNWSSWPLTGESSHARVSIQRFSCEWEGAILHIELEGLSQQSGHSYALETDVYFPEKGAGE